MDQQHQSTSSIALLTCNAALGYLFMGYSLSYMNPAINTANKQFDISNNTVLIDGFINALPAIGAAVGVYLNGPLNRAMSLRDGFVLADFLGILGFAFQLPLYIGTLLLGRFVMGLSIGLNSLFVPQYINSFAPKHLQGTLGTLNQTLFFIGMLIGFFMGCFFKWDGSDLDYLRVVLDFPMFFCVLRILFLAFIYTDGQPEYYIRMNDHAEAKGVLETIYKQNHVEEVFENIRYELEAQEKKKNDSRRSLISIVLQFIQQFSGINAIMIYSSGFFVNMVLGTPEEKEDKKNWLNIGIALTNLIFSLIAVAVSKAVGRKTLLLYGSIVSCVFLILITIAAYTMVDGSSSYHTMFVLSLYAYLASFQVALGPITGVYCSEILSQSSNLTVTALNWLFCALIALLFGVVRDATSLGFDFLLFSICTGLGAIFIGVFVLETKDKSREEVDNMFSMIGKTGIN